MSAPQEEVLNEDYFKPSLLRPSKPPAHMAALSPRDKRGQYVGSDTESSGIEKRNGPPQFIISSKLDISPVSRPKLGMKKESGAEEKLHPNTKSYMERVKSISINPPEKASPVFPSKFISRTPRVIEAEHEESSPKKETASLQSNFENFVLRFTKLYNTSMLPNPQPVLNSAKAYGTVKAFAYCTNQGLVRNYNEDRVTTALNLLKPLNKPANEKWPNCSFFCVYDGHGGARCADFLKDNLHHYVIMIIVKSRFFPWDPEEALKDGCAQADKDFLEIALSLADQPETKRHDRSGSCAIVMMILDNNCYLCNVGDSRAVVSQNLGASRSALTRDHKPSDPLEKQRVLEAGGNIYQNFPPTTNAKRFEQGAASNPLNIQVPFRISPGRLSISRAFGDIEAKLPKFGGNPDVLISQPEITNIILDSEIDFIVLGSDGIYDVLSNEELIGIVWDSLHTKKTSNIHDAMKLAAEEIIRQAMLKKSLDNVTAVVVCFNNLDFIFKSSEMSTSKQVWPKDLKLSEKSENLIQEDEGSKTERRRPSKSVKRFSKLNARVQTEDKSLSINDESNQYHPVVTNKGLITSPRLKLEKMMLPKKRLEIDLRSAFNFPKIPKMKTAR